jgi:uncharacterized membrane protein
VVGSIVVVVVVVVVVQRSFLSFCWDAFLLGRVLVGTVFFRRFLAQLTAPREMKLDGPALSGRTLAVIVARAPLYPPPGGQLERTSQGMVFGRTHASHFYPRPSLVVKISSTSCPIKTPTPKNVFFGGHHFNANISSFNANIIHHVLAMIAVVVVVVVVVVVRRDDKWPWTSLFLTTRRRSSHVLEPHFAPMSSISISTTTTTTNIRISFRLNRQPATTLSVDGMTPV